MKKLFYIFLVLAIILFGINLYVDIKYTNTQPVIINHFKNPIRVLYITDDNYIKPTSASINSIFKNKNKETEVEVYIIGIKLKKSNIERLKKLTKHNLDIKIIKYNKLLNKLPMNTPDNPVITRADYTKFKISSILKNDNKVLYLDGDTIVLKDLSNLYNIDLKDNYIAAADDWQSSWQDKRDDRYFNNGVMLMNLKQMRKDNIDEKLLKYKLEEKNKRFMTQDAYNNVLYKKVVFIPLYYNTFAPEYDNEDIINQIKKVLGKNFDKNLYPYKTTEEYRNSVVIIHYCGWGNLKPWWYAIVDKNRITSKIWYKYE